MLLILGLSTTTYANCGRGGICLTIIDVAKGLDEQQATKLINETKKITGDDFLKYCQPQGETNVAQIWGSFCAAGGVSPKICTFGGAFQCKYEGRTFPLQAGGYCVGGLHDCGTLKDCLKNTLPVADVSFRGDNDPVPKGTPPRASQQ